MQTLSDRTQSLQHLHILIRLYEKILHKKNIFPLRCLRFFHCYTKNQKILVPNIKCYDTCVITCKLHVYCKNITAISFSVAVSCPFAHPSSANRGCVYVTKYDFVYATRWCMYPPEGWR